MTSTGNSLNRTLPLSVGIAGFGTIGHKVADALDDGIDGLVLVGVCGRDRAKTENDVKLLRKSVPVLAANDLANKCLAVEARCT